MKEKILIYRHCSLGDFIVSLPAIKLIRDNHPNAVIYLGCLTIEKMGYVRPHQIPINTGLIDKFIYFERSWFSYLRFLIEIKKKKFNKMYYLNEIPSVIKLKRDLFLFNLSGIKEKAGFEKIKYNYDKFNETYYLCKRIKKKISKKDITFKNLINNSTNKSKLNYITISLGGKSDLKKWNIKNWIFIVSKIIIKYPNLKIKIIGSKNEKKMSEQITILNRKKIINLCGNTNIRQLFDIIDSSKYHISHDDGTMHIASTFKKKGIAIFGITSEKGRWFPSNSNQKIFYPKKHINQIKPEKIINFIYRSLDSLR